MFSQVSVTTLEVPLDPLLGYIPYDPVNPHEGWVNSNRCVDRGLGPQGARGRGGRVEVGVGASDWRRTGVVLSHR